MTVQTPERPRLADEFDAIAPPMRRPSITDLKGHLAWLIAASRIHSLVPEPVALSIARAIGRLRWLLPWERRRAIGRVSLTLAGTGREDEATALARDELQIHAMRRALSWRRRLAAEGSLEGTEHLDAALGSGRPVIIASIHSGTVGGDLAALCVHGYGPFAVVSGPWSAPRDGRMPRGFVGHRTRKLRRLAEQYGMRFIPAGGSYNVVRAHLERRIPCQLMVDMPGDVVTNMAGKTAYLRSGLARLAIEADALVVPHLSVLRLDGASYRLLEPIDPRDTGDIQDIVDRLAEVFGEAIVRDPASLTPIPFFWGIWRGEPLGYPLELWRRPRLRTRLGWRAASARRRVRRVLGLSTAAP